MARKAAFAAEQVEAALVALGVGQAGPALAAVGG
jgi:hypothetical protein